MIYMVQKIIIEPLCSHKDLKCIEGEFLPTHPLRTLINRSCDIYSSENGNKILIAKFRKGVISDKLSDLAIQSFKSDAKKATSIRGIASGKIDLKKLSKNIVAVVNPDSYKSRVVYKSGIVSNYYIANPVNSLIVGYFDLPTLHNKSSILRKKLDTCRVTRFTEQSTEKWKNVLPLINKVDNLYKVLVPTKHRLQKNLARKVKEFCIENTAFTTLTVNYNWQTACHVDKGDLTEGFSCITVSEEGKWSGGYLSLPRFGLSFDLRQGDILIFNPHEYHCNSPIVPLTKNYTRLSIVYYFREGMLKCAKSRQKTRPKTRSRSRSRPRKIKYRSRSVSR